MVQSHSDSILQQAELMPTKQTLTALKSDVDIVSACLELCDNALDAWKRTSNRKDSMEICISVDTDGETTSLTIRDNAGGIHRDNAAMLFGLGQTAKEGIPGSIGTYGVGAKKSLVNLGVPFKIASRSHNESSGWEYEITDAWFDDEQDWTVPVHTNLEIEPGVTEIQIQDLNYEWNAETAETLRERLGKAYNLFLSEEMQRLHNESYDLSITVDGVEVEAEGLPEWSFSPFDGLHPRRYENIQISSPEMDEPVSLDITVGLLTQKDSQSAGTDIYIQKRKVATGLRGNEGGFGTGKDKMGNFSPRHERLKAIIELETNGNGQMLPWDTQKSSIDTHNPLMRGTPDTRGIYNWIRRTVQDYYEIDADKIPRAFIEPYDAAHEWATNDGHPERLDYSTRKQVIAAHRPDRDLPEASDIQTKAAVHASLEIKCQDSLENWQVPAYRNQLSQESDKDIEDLTSISSPLPSAVLEDPHQMVGRINELARIHLDHDLYYPDELLEWQVPRYDEYIKQRKGTTPKEKSARPDHVPLRTEELENPDAESDSKPTSHSPAHTGRKIDDNSLKDERAEIFLVLGGDSDNERGAPVIEISRKELCDILDLEDNEVKEIIYDELREQINRFMKINQ